MALSITWDTDWCGFFDSNDNKLAPIFTGETTYEALFLGQVTGATKPVSSINITSYYISASKGAFSGTTTSYVVGRTFEIERLTFSPSGYGSLITVTLEVSITVNYTDGTSDSTTLANQTTTFQVYVNSAPYTVTGPTVYNAPYDGESHSMVTGAPIITLTRTGTTYTAAIPQYRYKISSASSYTSWSKTLPSITKTNVIVYNLQYYISATAVIEAYGTSSSPKTANSPTISKRVVTASWGTNSWTYDGNAHTATATLGNIIATDTVTATYSYIPSGGIINVSDSSTATATLVSVDNNNYTVPASQPCTSMTVNQKQASLKWQKITGQTVSDGTSWTYDGNTYSPYCTVDNLITGDSCTVTLDKSTTFKDAGDQDTITATALDNGNYELPSSVSQEYSVDYIIASLKWQRITGQTVSDGTSWEYDGNTYLPYCTVDNLITGDSCTVTLHKNDPLINAGDGYTERASGLSNSNYSLPSANSQAYSVTRKKLLRPYWYNSVNQFSFCNAQIDCTDYIVVDDAASIEGTTTGTHSNNSARLQATVKLTTNYMWSDTSTWENVTMDWYIIPATVTITFPDGAQTKTYGDANFTKAVTYSPNFVTAPVYASGNAARATVNSSTGEVTIVAPTADDTPSTVVITASIAAESTYGDWGAKSAKYFLTINKKTVEMEWTELQTHYDGTQKDPKGRVKNNQLVGSDVVTIVPNSETRINADTYTVTGSLGGTDAWKYILADSCSSQYEILRALSTIAWSPQLSWSFKQKNEVQYSETVDAPTNAYGTVSYSYTSHLLGFIDTEDHPRQLALMANLPASGSPYSLTVTASDQGDTNHEAGSAPAVTFIVIVTSGSGIRVGNGTDYEDPYDAYVGESYTDSQGVTRYQWAPLNSYVGAQKGSGYDWDQIS